MGKRKGGRLKIGAMEKGEDEIKAAVMGKRKRGAMEEREDEIPRTPSTTYPDLDRAYKRGKYVKFEMEDPARYVRHKGKEVVRAGWKPPEVGGFSGNVDASGNGDDFTWGFSIRNDEGTEVAIGVGRQKDPYKGDSSGFIETYACKKLLKKADFKEYAKLDIRCDNQQTIKLLDGTWKVENVRHRKFRKLLRCIDEMKKTKYPKGQKARLSFTLVCREDNFVADDLSHKGRRLKRGWSTYEKDLFEDDFTHTFLKEKDLGPGFCKCAEERRRVKYKKLLKTRKCGNCNTPGHIEAQCALKPMVQICHFCNKPGHFARVCPDRDPEALKRARNRLDEKAELRRQRGRIQEQESKRRRGQ